MGDIREFLEDVSRHLHLDSSTGEKVVNELYSHYQEKVSDLASQGYGKSQASGEAIRSFGRARVVARLMYEAHSRGSWTDAMVSCLPHLAAAVLFASHLWHHVVLAPLVLAVIIGATLLGWWRGKPNWLYSWIGYSLLPLLFAGYAGRHILIRAVVSLVTGTGGLALWWPLLLLTPFILLALWIILSTAARVVRRDWILASLVIVPLPIMGIWLSHVDQVGDLFRNPGWAMHRWDAIMAAVFFVLGGSFSVSIRLRQRHLKIGVLLIAALATTAVLIHNIWSELGLGVILVISVLLLAFYLSPALFRNRRQEMTRSVDSLLSRE